MRATRIQSRKSESTHKANVAHWVCYLCALAAMYPISLAHRLSSFGDQNSTVEANIVTATIVSGRASLASHKHFVTTRAADDARWPRGSLSQTGKEHSSKCGVDASLTSRPACEKQKSTHCLAKPAVSREKAGLSSNQTSLRVLPSTLVKGAKGSSSTLFDRRSQNAG